MRSLPARLALGLVALLAGSVLFVSGYTLGARTATTPGTPPGEAALWAPFWDTYRAVTERYALGPVAPEKLVQGAIGGLMGALDDPYSAYFPPADYRENLNDLSGRFEGIGAQLGFSATSGDAAACTVATPACRLTIVAPLPDSPAERAGILPGDLLLAIDGTTTAGLSVADATGRIRGPKGTTVRLTVGRAGLPDRTVAIVRQVIVEREVTSRTLGGGSVGYLRLTGFSDDGADQVVEAVRDHLAAGRRALVLDLRGNPGGFVTAAVRIASQFIGSGTIYETEDAAGARIATGAQPGGIALDPSIRLVVLVDRGTASASEIVAGALQDTGRATLVGSTTFGKGTIQGWQPLEHDAGGFKLTIARWLTPRGHWVHGTGLTPDVTVAPAAAGAGTDPVLARALALLGASDADAGPAPSRVPASP